MQSSMRRRRAGARSYSPGPRSEARRQSLSLAGGARLQLEAMPYPITHSTPHAAVGQACVAFGRDCTGGQ